MPRWPTRTTEQRFLDHVRHDGDCWIWTGTTMGSKGRYPSFRVGSRATDAKVPAHRWAYEHWVGPIPDGLEVDHLCKRRLCVNPAHLEPVTGTENSERARLALCKAGLHDLTNPANCRWDSRGRRRGCALCFPRPA